ncbi:MAG TPA: hypothetical protein VF184_00950 [Phycisphaeraceae bacterium]
MSKRLWVIGAACGLAAVVLLVSLLVGSGGGSASQQAATPPPPIQPDVNTRFDSERTISGDDIRQQPFEAIEGGRYTSLEGERRRVLTWQRMTPRPQGVSEVTFPVAQIYFTDNRVLEIRSDQGTFIAPENQPRQMDLRGHVVLTLFESEGGRPVDLQGLRDIRLRAYLDRASVDLEAGHVESDSEVYLVGPRVEFRGRGLSLTYNQLRRRIDRLEVFEGESFRLKPEARLVDAEAEAGSADSRAVSRDSAATQPRSGRGAGRGDRRAGARAAAGNSRGAGAKAKDRASSPASAAATQPDEAFRRQFYRARFQRDVQVRTIDGQMTMEGDELDVIFSLNTTQEQEPNAQPGQGESGPVDGGGRPRRQRSSEGGLSGQDRIGRFDPSRAGDELAASRAFVRSSHHLSGAAARGLPSLMAFQWTALAMGQVEAESSGGLSLQPPVPPVEPEDIVITWTGPLVVLPEEPPASMMDPDDMLLVLKGEPAWARTDQEQTIRGAVLQYQQNAGVLSATGSDTAPLVVDSPRAGVLRGASLLLDQSRGTGYVIGPGMLEASTAEAAAEQEPQERDLRIDWRDRLDFVLDRQEDQQNQRRRDTARSGQTSRGPASSLSGLRSAVFKGDVQVRHPQLELSSQTLRLVMDDPTGDQPRTLKRIEATGNISTRLRGQQDEDQVLVRSEILNIDLERDASGQAQPTRLVAKQRVYAQHQQMQLESQQLDVTLAQADSADKPAGDADVSADRLTIQRMIAQEAVRVSLEDEEVLLAGDRMIVEAGGDQIQLLGSEDSPARVVRPDATLSGPRLVIATSDQAVQTIDVIGPGWLDAQMDPDDPAAKLSVTWHDSMRYDDQTGEARFAGDVHSTTQNAKSRTRLSSEHLQLELARVEAQQDESAVSSTPQQAPSSQRSSLGRRRIRFAEATGDVVQFTADGFDPHEPDRPHTQIHLEGPRMIFQGESEQVQVIGAGRMLIQDHRPPQAAPADEASSDVRFTGRGATLFLWQKRLTLDAARNDMLLEQTVQMIHQPADGGRAVQLDAQSLLADLEETGGLGVWGSGDAPQPDIRLVQADQLVRVIEAGRTVTSDHLRYTEADQTVVFWADAGRLVQVTDPQRPTPLRAGQIKWSLEGDRFEILQPGPAVVPLTR